MDGRGFESACVAIFADALSSMGDFGRMQRAESESSCKDGSGVD
jgi:hypothetical protein